MNLDNIFKYMVMTYETFADCGGGAFAAAAQNVNYNIYNRVCARRIRRSP